VVVYFFPKLAMCQRHRHGEHKNKQPHRHGEQKYTSLVIVVNKVNIY